MPKFEARLETTINALNKDEDPQENEFIDSSRLVYDGVREIRYVFSHKFPTFYLRNFTKCVLLIALLLVCVSFNAVIVLCQYQTHDVCLVQVCILPILSNRPSLRIFKLRCVWLIDYQIQSCMYAVVDEAIGLYLVFMSKRS